MGFDCYGHLEAGNSLYQPRQVFELLKIHEGELFETEHLLSLVGDKVKKYAIVYAGRQAGKTSLIMHLKQEILDREVAWPIWMDFQRIYGASSEQTLLFVARQIIENVPELRKINPPKKFALGGLEFDHWLADLPFDKPLVIFMEELGALPLKSRQALGTVLRSVFTGRYRTRLEKVMIFFFGGIEMNQMAIEEVSPLKNICKEYILANLTLQATQNLLEVGLAHCKTSSTNVDFEHLSRFVFGHTAGHPYLSQRFGEELVCKDTSLPPDDMEKLVDSIGSLLSRDQFVDHTYRMVVRYQLLKACRKAFNHPDYSSLIEDWSKLLLLGVVRVDGGTVDISTPLLGRVLVERLQPASQKKVATASGKAKGKAETVYKINSEGGTVVIGNVNTGGGSFVGRDQANLGVEQHFPVARLEAMSVTLTNTLVEPESAEVYQLRRKQILDQIILLPCLQNESKREASLMRASLQEYLPKIDLSGTPNEAVLRMFAFLEQLKRSKNGPHPLGLFLADAKAQAEEKNQETIQLFIDQYGLL